MTPDCSHYALPVTFGCPTLQAQAQAAWGWLSRGKLWLGNPCKPAQAGRAHHLAVRLAVWPRTKSKLEPAERVQHTGLGSVGGCLQEELPAYHCLVLLHLDGLAQECDSDLCVGTL